MPISSPAWAMRAIGCSAPSEAGRSGSSYARSGTALRSRRIDHSARPFPPISCARFFHCHQEGNEMRNEESDVAGLFPRMDLSRRGFVMTSLATGFAPSVTPAKATMITTDTDGLTAGEVKIPVADGEIPAYRAQPAKGHTFPVVIVVEEIFGVHEHIKDLRRRRAKRAYLAIAPELYARLGDVPKIEDIKEVIAVVDKLHDDQAFSDLDATIAWGDR